MPKEQYKDVLRTEKIVFLVTRDEKRRIDEKAAKYGLDRSNYLRYSALKGD